MSTAVERCAWKEKLANLVNLRTAHSGEKSATQNGDKKIIKLPAGEKLTIAIACPLKQVPEGVQIAKAAGGNFSLGQQPQKQEGVCRFSHTFVDKKGLLQRISINSINVIETSDASCVVYINAIICTPANGDMFENPWNINLSYGPFVEKLLSWRYKTVILKPRQQGDLVLQLRGCSNSEENNKVFFTN